MPDTMVGAAEPNEVAENAMDVRHHLGGSLTGARRAVGVRGAPGGPDQRAAERQSCRGLLRQVYRGIVRADSKRRRSSRRESERVLACLHLQEAASDEVVRRGRPV